MVRPKASRRVPGVNVPVAAPSWALDLTVAAELRQRAALGGRELARVRMLGGRAAR